MIELNDTLVVTAPSWGSASGLLAIDFKRINDDYHVDVVDSPLLHLGMSNDAVLRRVLRELADWDAVKDKTALTVVCSGQAAADALENFDPLCLALRLRADRLKFATLDMETASALSEVCHLKDIAKFHYKSVATAKPAGEMDELVGKLMRHEEPRELFLVLEAEGSNGMLAKKMIANGLRVIRLGYYIERVAQLASLGGIDPKGLWMLAMDLDSVRPIVSGLIRQGINPAVVKWIGNRPSVGDLVRHEVPDATWVNVPELKPSVVLETISKY
ncbi:MAG: hypothetical protein NWS83_00310 [Burkholderiaceae bacterium]|jgi:hypothetical protein|nr:hypothetical protein [Burkholderiaceae bacterium]